MFKKLFLIFSLITLIPYSAFAVSTATCNDTDTVLMLHQDGTDTSTTFTDNSTSAHTMTAAGNAQIKTAQSKFGGASGYYDGTGDWVTTPDSADWDLTGDFTIDAWVRFDDFTHSAHCFVGNGWNASGWMVCPYLEGTFYVFHNNTVAISNVPSAYSANTWYHIAVTRSGSTMAIYRDGTQLTTATYSTSMSGSTNSLYVGADAIYQNTGALKGYLDELRIVKGTAVWTSSFTAPTSAYADNCSTRRRILYTTVD